jgi:hypothetical protein
LSAPPKTSNQPSASLDRQANNTADQFTKPTILTSLTLGTLSK